MEYNSSTGRLKVTLERQSKVQKRRRRQQYTTRWSEKQVYQSGPPKTVSFDARSESKQTKEFNTKQPTRAKKKMYKETGSEWVLSRQKQQKWGPYFKVRRLTAGEIENVTTTHNTEEEATLWGQTKKKKVRGVGHVLFNTWLSPPTPFFSPFRAFCVRRVGILLRFVLFSRFFFTTLSLLFSLDFFILFDIFFISP